MGWVTARRGGTAVGMGLGPLVRAALTPALPTLLSAALDRSAPAPQPAAPAGAPGRRPEPAP